MYLATIASKNLQKSSVIQNTSVTLFWVFIVILLLFFVFQYYKVTISFDYNHSSQVPGKIVPKTITEKLLLPGYKTFNTINNSSDSC